MGSRREFNAQELFQTVITFLQSSVFESPAQTLVNTVNTVGVMGKGIAKQFKTRYPDMYKQYREICDLRGLEIGELHLWRGDNRWVLNFPTKTTWRKPSELRYVERGLMKFVSTYSDLGITSASFPPLGCGNGNLDWDVVRPMMEHYLSQVTIPIYIHDVQVAESFVAEHVTACIPNDFDGFLADLEHHIDSRKHTFYTTRDSQFRADLSDEGNVLVETQSGRTERIDREYMHSAWIRLRDRILSYESFSDEKSRKLKSYFFPLIIDLPYIRHAKIRSSISSNAVTDGFYLDRESASVYSNPSDDRDKQGWLFR